ncbi:MAG: DUF4249 domain-containing protein [Flavobacteriales bacterium]|nr:DUF4249 domain-containing protein [Flavobacteriales bacterium]
MKNILSIFILFAFWMLLSCEKVVDLELDKAPQAIVVEALVFDSIGDNYVIISKSKAFNDNTGTFETVSGATVIISDNIGNSYNLSEVFPGVYNSSTLEGVVGRTYFLNINAEGKSITAYSTMPPKINLDSLSYEKNDQPFNDDEQDTYRVFTHFYDAPGVENFYRIKAFSKNVTQKGVLVLNDDLIEGDNVVFPVFQTDFEENDTVTVQLLSIEEVNFRYFNALVSSQDGEVPGNPETNLNGGENIVGYFSANAKSQKTIITTPLP